MESPKIVMDALSRDMSADLRAWYLWPVACNAQNRGVGVFRHPDGAVLGHRQSYRRAARMQAIDIVPARGEQKRFGRRSPIGQACGLVAARSGIDVIMGISHRS